MVADEPIEAKKIWKLLETVTDPEIPVLTIHDLGIVRDIQISTTGSGEKKIDVIITPTYSGCPAMDAISIDIKLKLLEQGYKNVQVISVLSPAWTTDWMSESGKQKLKEYGIAPPKKRSDNAGLVESVSCPHCNSSNTRRISEFGSTACKSLYQCNDCKEPFDHFKCH